MNVLLDTGLEGGAVQIAGTIVGLYVIIWSIVNFFKKNK